MNRIREKYYYRSDTIFDNVRKSISKELDLNSKLISVPKNKIIMKEGTYPDGVYKLIKGKVKIYQSNSEGKFQIVYLYTRGEFFGFRPILSDTKNPVSAETMEECQLRFYPKSVFLKTLEDSPTMMKNLLRLLSYEFNVWVNLLATFSHKSVKERVALALLILNEKYKKQPDDNTSVINIGREDLGSFCGTTTETCVRILTQFKKEGILNTDGRKIRLVDTLKLLNYIDLV